MSSTEMWIVLLLCVSVAGVVLIRSVFSQRIDSLGFLVASRQVGLELAMVTVAVCWAQAPAFLVSSQKAFEQGVPGLVWFVVPNAASLLIVAWLGSRMRQVFDGGYTLAQFMGLRLGRRIEVIYVIETAVRQTYSLLLVLVGSLLVLQAVTGLSKEVIVVYLGITILGWSMMKGFRSALVADLLKFGWIIVGLVTALIVIGNGGMGVFLSGLGGSSGKFTSPLDSAVAWSFGVPFTVSILGAASTDESQWQRVFSFRRGIVRCAYIGGFCLFSVIVLVFGLLGFEAAGRGMNAQNTQTIGLAVISQTLPIGAVVFGLLILFALVATGTGALNAFSSVGSVNVWRMIRRRPSDAELLRVSRSSMVGLVCVAMGIALIPGISLLYLLLLVGVIRSAVLIPTVLALYWRELSPGATFWGIILAVSIGVPLFVYGSVTGNANIQSFGSLIPLAITSIACGAGSRIWPGRFNYLLLQRDRDNIAA